MKYTQPIIIAILLIILLFKCNEKPTIINNSKIQHVRDSALYVAKIQRKKYERKTESLKIVRDTLYRTITKWKDRPVITIEDKADSCCEVGYKYMVAYNAASAALSACDTLQRTELFRVVTDSTALKLERKSHRKTKRRSTFKSIGSFIVGIFVGKSL